MQKDSIVMGRSAGSELEMSVLAGRNDEKETCWKI